MADGEVKRSDSINLAPSFNEDCMDNGRAVKWGMSHKHGRFLFQGPPMSSHSVPFMNGTY